MRYLYHAFFAKTHFLVVIKRHCHTSLTMPKHKLPRRRKPIPGKAKTGTKRPLLPKNRKKKSEVTAEDGGSKASMTQPPAERTHGEPVTALMTCVKKWDDVVGDVMGEPSKCLVSIWTHAWDSSKHEDTMYEAHLLIIVPETRVVAFEMVNLASWFLSDLQSHDGPIDEIHVEKTQFKLMGESIQFSIPRNAIVYPPIAFQNCLGNIGGSDRRLFIEHGSGWRCRMKSRSAPVSAYCGRAEYSFERNEMVYHDTNYTFWTEVNRDSTVGPDVQTAISNIGIALVRLEKLAKSSDSRLRVVEEAINTVPDDD